MDNHLQEATLPQQPNSSSSNLKQFTMQKDIQMNTVGSYGTLKNNMFHTPTAE